LGEELKELIAEDAGKTRLSAFSMIERAHNELMGGRLGSVEKAFLVAMVVGGPLILNDWVGVPEWRGLILSRWRATMGLRLTTWFPRWPSLHLFLPIGAIPGFISLAVSKNIN
jgi:hypothetical protein